jgi:hypothetical protein
MIVIYLGDVGSYLADLAQATDSTATLLTVENCNELTSGTYYTSVADLENFQNLSSVLRSADKIVYAPPPNNLWSDTKKNHSQIQAWTEDYLKIFSFRTSVKNFSLSEPANKSSILQLADSRKSLEKQLWIAGCSVSHGVGVELTQRYGQLLAQDLNLPVSFLTKGGSSVIWAADQILRSNIQPNDLVIWGITSMPRVPWFDNKLNHIATGSYESNPKLSDKFSFEYFISDDITYRTVTSVFQVINYCENIGAKLLLVSLIDDGTVFSYLKDLSNLLQLSLIWGRDLENMFLDLGTDGVHPGPKTHEFYADEILAKIKHLQWI